jgi:hypothetical protein
VIVHADHIRDLSHDQASNVSHAVSIVVGMSGHHVGQGGAVLGAVNASVLAHRPRHKRDAASGIDRASAQRYSWHLRDGRSVNV